jgi:ubiquinone/menaquinone biosynthesis C-methylase UbiE
MIGEKYIESHIRNLKIGLELGCGYGGLMLKLLKAGFEVYGVDICEYCVNYANRVFRENGFDERCYVMNAESLSFPDNSFDFIYVIISLHEMNAEKVAREGFRVLKQRGIFIDIDWAPWANTGVSERYLDIEEVEKIFAEAGFIVKEAFYDGELEYLLFTKILQ